MSKPDCRLKIPRTKYHFAVLTLLMLLLGLATALFGWVPETRAAATPAWRDSGLNLPTSLSNLGCLDATRPDTLLASETLLSSGTPTGTYAINWATRQASLVSSHRLDLCDAKAGLFFQVDSVSSSTGVTTTITRFTHDDPQGRNIAHLPTAFPLDGSLRLYSVEKSALYFSPDGGLSWQPRDLSFIGQGLVQQLYIAPADSRVLYALVQDATIANTNDHSSFSIYFSADTGNHWGKRYQSAPDYFGFSASAFPSILPWPTANLPVSTLLLNLSSGGGPSSNITTLYASNDQGCTFNKLGITSRGEEVQGVAFSNQGLVRLHRVSTSTGTGLKVDFFLELSSDAGKNWQPLSLPSGFNTAGFNYGKLSQNPNIADELLLSGLDASNATRLWQSLDGGKSWAHLPDLPGNDFLITPYLPTSLLSYNESQGKLYTLDVSAGDKSSVNKAKDNQTGNYYAQTSHNISPLFKDYWNQQGGLAQFGYPTTEPFRELNPSDGKIYLAQYFERNRFEYHPDLANTPYEVLLGLLGNQLTENRRGEAAFKPVSDPKLEGVRYFAPTGHTLSGAFLDYWQAKGGLALYGYPISEIFEEQNPDDGKTYQVQYFERNRFELHPENKGTPYEVLLGLLGNSLLRLKGWY